MKTKINKYFHLLIVIAIIILINIYGLRTSLAQYLNDDVEVPVFEGIKPETKFIFWDLSEINTQNNRLDVTVGINEHGEDYDFTHANWYKNSGNNNFNSEDTNTRIIYTENLDNEITGLYIC